MIGRSPIWLSRGPAELPRHSPAAACRPDVVPVFGAPSCFARSCPESLEKKKAPRKRRAFEAKAAEAPAGLLGPAYMGPVSYPGTFNAGVSTAVRGPFCFLDIAHSPDLAAGNCLIVHATVGAYGPKVVPHRHHTRTVLQ